MINRVNNEGDSLGAFHLRIAAFDAGCANATAGQEAPPTKDGGIERPKRMVGRGFLSQSLFIPLIAPTYSYKNYALASAYKTIAFAIRSVDPTYRSQSLFIPLVII